MRTRFESVDKETGEVWFTGVSVTVQRPCERCGKPTKCDRTEGYCCIDEGRGLGWCGHVTSKNFFHLGSAQTVLHIPRSRLESPRRAVQRDWDRLVEIMIEGAPIATIAKNLPGVTVEALRVMETGWYRSRKLITWPMRNEMGDIVGIRTRTLDGEKRAFAGSTNGLFWPLNQDWEKPIYLPEGPTDCAALIGLGFTAIGRPSALTGRRLLAPVVQDCHVVIVGDPDSDGERGAASLAEAVAESAKSVRVIYPLRGRDIRKWIGDYGADRAAIEAVTDNARKL